MIFTNKHNLPDRILKQISLPHKPVKDRISTTDLIDSPRERQLLFDRWDDITVDYSDFLTTLHGIAIHGYQEKVFKDVPEMEMEVKFEDKVGLFTIVGKADNYNTIEKIIRETKDKAVGALKYEEFLREVEEQLNIYAWQRRNRNFEVNGLELDIFYRDWKKWEADKANSLRWAIMKKGRKTAIKVHDKYEDAVSHLASLNPDEHYIEKREGNSDYPKLLIDHSIPIKLWTYDIQKEFVNDKCELFNLDPYYCGEEFHWKNNLKCREYCNARCVCKDSPCYMRGK